MEKKYLTKWDYNLLVDIYILAKQGLDNPKIRDHLAIKRVRWNTWLKKYPEIETTLGKARKDPTQGGTRETFSQYVARHLSPDLKPIWDELVGLRKQKALTIDKIEKIFRGKSKMVRQSIFVHSYLTNSFQTAKAMELVGIGKQTLDDWIHNSEEFRRLMDEIQWHKKNFFEDGLMALVRMGNPHAILHVNKTVNKDRGYGETLKIEGSIDVNHHHLVDVSQLNLPVAVLEQIEAAMAEAEKKANAIQLPPADNKGDE